MTQSIQKLLGDNPKTSKLSVSARKLHRANPSEEGLPTLFVPPMHIVSAPGLHKAIVPRLEQVFVEVQSEDKLGMLFDVLSSQRSEATIIFCNTASSVRAVQYALEESGMESLGYHGELNSAARAENLAKFRRQAASSFDDEGLVDVKDKRKRPKHILVCTDLAARGLDIPQVDHVVMFDFPLNALDYLHRSGRTARGSGSGKVTALVAKRDRVLATAIERAVQKGESLDGLSSRKSDYLPGARLGKEIHKNKNNDRKGTMGRSRSFAKNDKGPRQRNEKGYGKGMTGPSNKKRTFGKRK
eukprot:Nitzschia sp. Nitz4//scaffold15_size197535//6687//7586//NITZ4_001546-RA/size197535-processed-gene-0.43-mRNA-1//-1//CDS//3329537619//20//frame0